MDVKKELRELDKLLLSGSYDLALNYCSKLIDLYQNTEHQYDVFRKRSFLYEAKKDLQSAYLERLEILDSNYKKIEDYFFAAVYGVRLKKYTEVIPLIAKGIAICEESSDHYYLDEIKLISALIMVRLNEFSSAEMIVSGIENNIKVWIDRPNNPHTRDEILRASRENIIV